jgi:hypothetical protein
LRILGLLVAEDDAESARHLCSVCATVTGMTGAGVMLMDGPSPRGSVCTSGEASETIERLQYDLGEGPCIDAHNLGHPVLEPDLAHPATVRWVAFAGPAVAAGACAVFGFPMRVGGVRLGALNLYRDAPGPMDDERYADALAAADVAAEAVLMMQAGAPPGQLAMELEASSNFRYVAHQAAGMVAAQLDTNVREALIRLRAHAFSTGRTLDEIAGDVVARTLRFEPDTDPGAAEATAPNPPTGAP